MAELAKCNKRNCNNIQLGSKISVPRNFFDTGKSTFSANLPKDASKWFGEVIRIIEEESGRVEVLWHFDGTSMTYLNKLQLEQNTTEPAQSSCSTNTSSKSDGAPAKQLFELLHDGKVIFHGYKETETANIVHWACSFQK